MLFSYEINLNRTSNIQKETKKFEIQISLKRDNSKELVIDKATGLMWQDNIDAKTIKKNRKDAKHYCRRLVFAGYDDWHLPRIKELKSIVDKQKTDPAIRKGFKNIISSHYWSSSPNLSDTMNALNIDFKSGQIYNNYRKGKGYVRCVRGKKVF